MKKLFKISIIAFLGIGMFSSCAKKTTTTPAATSSMSATISGTNWTASSVSGTNNSGILFVAGLGPNSSTISIELPSNATAGTDSVSASEFSYVVAYSTASISYSMTKGALVISSNSGGTISGTFSGTMTDPIGGTSVSVTKGAFTAKYQ